MTTKERTIEHTCETLFDIPPGTTVIEVDEPIDTVADLPECESYDDLDKDLDDRFQQVADAAMTVFTKVRQDVEEDMDPKYAARTLEVGNQYLNTALGALKERANLKRDKDKHVATSKQVTNQTNNVMIMDRNEMLKHMLSLSQGNTIDHQE